MRITTGPLKFILTLLIVGSLGALPATSVASSKAADIWAFGDTHGAYTELVLLLQQAGLIDAEHNWSGGNATLITTGDVLDRGPQSRQILDLMMRLERQAAAAGGQFQFLLGNHEVMILVGDLRYVSPLEYAEFANEETAQMREQYFAQFIKYQRRLHQEINPQSLRLTFEQQYPPGFFARFKAFSPGGIYADWLLEKPFMVNHQGNLFTHGGLSPALAGKTLDSLNQELKLSLVNYIKDWHQLINTHHLPVMSSFKERHLAVRGQSLEPVEKFQQHLQQLLFSKQSPTWYRGAKYCHPYYEQENLDARLAQFNATRLFVGHSVTASKQVEVFLERAYLMDTGMLKSVYNGQASILKIEPHQVSVLTSAGHRYSPQAGAHTAIRYPEAFTQTQLLALLESGEIARMEKLLTGITEPYRLTFADPRAPVRALFKTIDTNPGIERRRTLDIEERYADRYLYDIAAYRLSELLGMHLVPVSVEREINKVKGVAQYWVENSYSEYTAEQEEWSYEGYCDYQQQRNLLNVFDLLIYNKDRNVTNILIEQEQGQLIWIDHSRAFSTHTNLPREIDRDNLHLTESVKRALEALDRDNLNEALGDLLNRDQIRTILVRRNKILSLETD